MSVLDVLREAVSDGPATLFECRNCGEKLAEEADVCHNCEASEIARYEF